ncbi:hypothetical protein HAX54_005183 [Datura stramonium]|uniref:Uncharacterized protein n=1 Tax=Datura stramonium TaxID=4076 RepID=A0ABS8WVE4_DATST|nr:hypothetical protein [Datura stramonium]
MDSTPTQVYEDFVPSTKLVQEEHSTLFNSTLPGPPPFRLTHSHHPGCHIQPRGRLFLTEASQGGQCIDKSLEIPQSFKKEQLRVQLTKTGILKISGETLVGTPNKWLRSEAEFPVAENCDKSKISAKKILPSDGSSSSSSSESESTDDETIEMSCLDANLKKPRKVMKMTLVALSVLSIGLYITT